LSELRTEGHTCRLKLHKPSEKKRGRRREELEGRRGREVKSHNKPAKRVGHDGYYGVTFSKWRKTKVVHAECSDVSI